MNEAHTLLSQQAEAPHPTVLVVEDDILVRTVISAYLREYGLEVVEAGNADEAARILTVGVKVDLVFSDVNMPGTMDGLGLATWMHDSHPHTKMILTSGVVQMTAQSGKTGAYGPILPKPYRCEDVARRICEMLDYEVP
jgi:two-component system, response regulator PdtaR